MPNQMQTFYSSELANVPKLRYQTSYTDLTLISIGTRRWQDLLYNVYCLLSNKQIHRLFPNDSCGNFLRIHFIAYVLKSPNYSTLFLCGVFCDLWNLKLQEKEPGMSNNLGHLYITVCHKQVAQCAMSLSFIIPY